MKAIVNFFTGALSLVAGLLLAATFFGIVILFTVGAPILGMIAIGIVLAVGLYLELTEKEMDP